MFKDTKRQHLAQPQSVQPAAIWQQIQRYPLPHQQTRQQLHSPGQETPLFIIKTQSSEIVVAALKRTHTLFRFLNPCLKFFIKLTLWLVLLTRTVLSRADTSTKFFVSSIKHKSNMHCMMKWFFYLLLLLIFTWCCYNICIFMPLRAPVRSVIAVSSACISQTDHVWSQYKEPSIIWGKKIPVNLLSVVSFYIFWRRFFIRGHTT